MTHKPTDEIRRYGPGKFDTILDSYVYQVSLDGGPDAELGSVDETGRWYGLIKHGHTIFQDHDPTLETLNSAERKQLCECAGVIISEDSQGFVSVEYFERMSDLDTHWMALEEYHEEIEAEAEGEETL